MKKVNLFLYSFLLLLVFYSCNNKNNTVDQQPELNQTNNYYEGYLFTKTITDSITSLNSSIKDLENLIKHHSNNNITELKNTRDKLVERKATFENYIVTEKNYSQQLFDFGSPIIGPIDPIDPPSPCTEVTACFLNSIKHIVVYKNIKQLQLKVRKLDNNEVFFDLTIDKNLLSNYENLISVGNINLKNSEDTVYFEVDRTYNDNSMFSYKTKPYKLFTH